MFRCDSCGKSGVFVSTRAHSCVVCGARKKYCPECESSSSNTFMTVWLVLNKPLEVESEKCLEKYVAGEAQALWRRKFAMPFSKLARSASLDDLKNPDIDHAAQSYRDFNLFYREHNLFSKKAAHLIWRSLRERMDPGWKSFAVNLETAGRIDDAARVNEHFGHFDEAGRIRQRLGAPQFGITEIRTGTIQIQNAPIQLASIDQRDQSQSSTVIQDSVVSRSNVGSQRPFSVCPYCGEALDLPKVPKLCPYCKERLTND